MPDRSEIEIKMRRFSEEQKLPFHDIGNLAMAMDNTIDSTTKEHRNTVDAILGDALLELVILEKILRKTPAGERHPKKMQLRKSSLTKNETQMKVLEDWHFRDYCFTEHGFMEQCRQNEQPETALDHIPYLEAIVYRLYVDRGMRICRTWIDKVLYPQLDHAYKEIYDSRRSKTIGYLKDNFTEVFSFEDDIERITENPYEDTCPLLYFSRSSGRFLFVCVETIYDKDSMLEEMRTRRTGLMKKQKLKKLYDIITEKRRPLEESDIRILTVAPAFETTDDIKRKPITFITEMPLNSVICLI